jgi:hypothetical protein
VAFVAPGLVGVVADVADVEVGRAPGDAQDVGSQQDARQEADLLCRSIVQTTGNWSNLPSRRTP